jgi:hypothetical protein
MKGHDVVREMGEMAEEEEIGLSLTQFEMLSSGAEAACCESVSYLASVQ